MKPKDILTFILLSALWGGSYLFMRLCVGSINAIAIAEFRLLIATAFIGFLLLLKKSWQKNLYIPRKDWPKLLFIAIFNSVLPFIVIAYAIQTLNAGTASILNATSPIWTAVIAVVWFKDHLNLSRAMGLVLGFSGVIVLMWGRASLGGDGLGLAVIAALMGTLSYGICSNYLKRYAAGFHPLAITFWSMLIAGILLATPALYNIPVQMSFNAWIGIFGLGIFSTAIAYLLFFKLAESTSPSIAITVTFLVPVFSMLWGEIFLGEEITARMLLGALVVLSGTALAIGLISFGKPKPVAASSLPMD